jgi:hypothetical protein
MNRGRYVAKFHGMRLRFRSLATRCDALEGLYQPCQRIDIVHLGGVNERCDVGPGAAAPGTAGKREIFRTMAWGLIEIDYPFHDRANA